MRNLIKAVQSYAISIIVGLFRFPKRLIVGIARFLKWISELIIREAIGAGFKALFGGAIFIAFVFWMLEIFGVSKAKIILFLILDFFL